MQHLDSYMSRLITLYSRLDRAFLLYNKNYIVPCITMGLSLVGAAGVIATAVSDVVEGRVHTMIPQKFLTEGYLKTLDRT